MKRLLLLPLRITCRVDAPVVLPRYKGWLFHGAFGRALAAVSPELRRAMFPNAAGLCQRATPNPFLLLPPLDRREGYRLGERFVFGLTLMGAAVELLPACLAALQCMAERGLHYESGAAVPFRIEQVDQQTPWAEAGWQALWAPEQGLTLGQPHVLTGADLPSPDLKQGVEITFLTPTEIMADMDRRCAPEFPLLFRRLLGRAAMIASELHGFELLAAGEKSDLLDLAQPLALALDATSWHEPDAGPMARQRAFGGFLGTAVYRGDPAHLAPLAPWLGLAQTLRLLTKKTSYGFGLMRCREPQF